MAKKSAASKSLPVVDDITDAPVAPTPAIEQPSAAFQVVALDLIDESPTNPRKTFGDMGELAESVRKNGVLQPVLVRQNGARFELVFGHRRFRAAKAAGRTDIPAFVREMNDLEVLEAQLVENAQRADIHELEEADGFKRLHTEHGKSVEEIAAKTGKSASYVYGRMKLAELVDEKAREACFDGSLSPSIALLVARLNPADQKKASTELLRNRGSEGVSFRWAKEFVEREFMLELAHAPFDVDDDGLVAAAGACAKCPKRTTNQPTLFGADTKDDRCTDSKCYAEKKAAARSLVALKAKQDGFKMLTEAEESQAFDRWEKTKDSLSYNSNFVKVHGPCSADSKNRMWKVMVGENAPQIYLGQGPSGSFIQLYSEKEAISAATKAGNLKKEKRSSSSSHFGSSPKKSKPEDKAAAELREKAEPRAKMLIHEAALKVDARKAFRWLGFEAYRALSPSSEIEQKHGLAKNFYPNSLKDVAKIKDEVLFALAFSGSVDDLGFDYGTHKPSKDLITLGAELGIDVEKIYSQALIDVSGAPKPAEKKPVANAFKKTADAIRKSVKKTAKKAAAKPSKPKKSKAKK